MQAIVKMLTMQLKNNGISKEEYEQLGKSEQLLLEQRGEKHYLKDSQRKKIQVVLPGGVFDVVHIGHIITLREAKKHGDLLVVAVASDDHIRKKGREPIHPLEYRRILVSELRSVDVAVSGFPDPKKMLEFVRPNVIVYGYDQNEFLKPEGVEIVKLNDHFEEAKFKSGKILQKLGI